MVRRGVLLPLLAAAEIVVLLGFMYFIVPPAFVIPCPEPGGEAGHGVSSPAPAPSPGSGSSGCEDGSLCSSPASAPSPVGSGGCEEAGDCICLRVPLAVVLAASGIVAYITASTGNHCYDWFVDGEEEEKVEAAGEAKKAGYVAIKGGDLEAAGKN